MSIFRQCPNLQWQGEGGTSRMITPLMWKRWKVRKDLTASEIGVRPGSVDSAEDIQAFVFELLEIPYYYKYRMQVV